jgi:hypothetical protein
MWARRKQCRSSKGGGNEIDPNGMRMDDDVLSRSKPNFFFFFFFTIATGA